MNLTEVEKAYLAGLFDGEGWIGYYLSRTCGAYSVCVGMLNTDFRALTWIQAHIPFGRVRTKHDGTRRMAWEWTLRSKKHAKIFLMMIRPYLIIKADQADLLLSHLDAEQAIPYGQGMKIPADFVVRRREVAMELKSLKRMDTQGIH